MNVGELKAALEKHDNSVEINAAMLSGDHEPGCWENAAITEACYLEHVGYFYIELTACKATE